MGFSRVLGEFQVGFKWVLVGFVYRFIVGGGGVFDYGF